MLFKEARRGLNVAATLFISMRFKVSSEAGIFRVVPAYFGCESFSCCSNLVASAAASLTTSSSAVRRTRLGDGVPRPLGFFGSFLPILPILSDQTAARALVPHLSGAFLSVTARAGAARIARERGEEGQEQEQEEDEGG